MDNNDKKERIIVPIICLLMSIGLWFYVSNVENTVRTYDLSKVPVEILNLDTLKDSKLVLSPNQEFYVNLKLEGTNEIYKIKREDFKITVDLSEYALKKGENKIPVRIVNSPIGMTIKNTNNLNVVINLEEISEKTMEIKSEISVSAKAGYFISTTEIAPKEVKIKGPESLVARVNSVVVRGEVSEATEDVKNSYPLIAVDNVGKAVEGVELKDKYADVSIKVSKGRSIPIKISTMGQLSADLKLKSIEASRKTSEIIGTKEILDSITELKTESVDLSKIKDNQDITVKVLVPDGTRLVAGDEFVTVKISVIKTISKELEIPLILKGITEGLVITPEKNTIKVRITAFEDKIESITIDKIKAELNVESFKQEGSFEGTPVITLVGLDSEVTAVPIEKIKFNVKKGPTPPVAVVP